MADPEQVRGNSLSLDPEFKQIVGTSPEVQTGLDTVRIAEISSSYDDVKAMLSFASTNPIDISRLQGLGASEIGPAIQFALNMSLEENLSFPEMQVAVRAIIDWLIVYHDFHRENQNIGTSTTPQQDYSHIAVLSLDQQMQMALNLYLVQSIAERKRRSWRNLEDLLAILNDPEIEYELQLIIQQAGNVRPPDYSAMVAAIQKGVEKREKEENLSLSNSSMSKLPDDLPFNNDIDLAPQSLKSGPIVGDA